MEIRTDIHVESAKVQKEIFYDPMDDERNE
jgi:hypothetical protein